MKHDLGVSSGSECWLGLVGLWVTLHGFSTELYWQFALNLTRELQAFIVINLISIHCGRTDTISTNLLPFRDLTLVFPPPY
jgi:hypothetical protein